MGGDKVLGTFSLDKTGKSIINYNINTNRDFYLFLNQLGKRIAKATCSWWMPNIIFNVFKVLEVPHNQGGLPMGNNSSDGVVDHAGRVFGYKNLMVLDGSIIPVSPRPNPALTILAICERAMEHVFITN